MSKPHDLSEKNSLRDSLMGKKLIIAGGAIGGFAAALALIRSGFDVAVYERAPAFTEIGAGMSLWPNASRVLHSLGVLDEVLASGEPVAQFKLYRPSGKLISEIGMTGFQNPALCIDRADLHRAMRKQIPEWCLVTGRRLKSFEHESDGVIARFEGGHEECGDGLVAANGINSVVRAQIHGQGEAIYQGYCTRRGIAPSRTYQGSRGSRTAHMARQRPPKGRDRAVAEALGREGSRFNNSSCFLSFAVRAAQINVCL
jgi:2-polyprenyl-6-methoxyphenol hydroxylase-like FAD-dependent oxidoreductase